MGTEVLRPQDCLNQRLGVDSPAVFPRRKSFYGTPRVNRKQPVRPIPDRSKRNSQSEPSISKRSSSDDLKSTKNTTTSTANIVVGQVTILRRGESLDSKIKSAKKDGGGDDEQIVAGTTERLGPESPEMVVPKQIRMNDLKSFLLTPPPPAVAMTVRPDMYAGSAFSMSPSPSSLPVPSFSKKKQVSPIIVDSATRDLRRLLRLE